MNYLCVAFTAAWVIYFVYLLYLNRQLQNVRSHLDDREKQTTI